MKKVISIILACAVMFAFAACGSSSTNASNPSTASSNASASSDDNSASENPTVITLSLAHHWNGDSLMETEQFDGYFKAIEEALDGKYQFNIEYYPTGTLLSEADIYDGVVDNVVNMGGTSATMNAERFLCLNLINYPGAATRSSAAANSRIIQEYYETYEFEEFSDVKVLYCWGNTVNMIHSTKPIETLEDLQGLTIRVTGVSADLFTALGATPISMSWGEVASAAQKGLIDGAFGTPNMLTDYNLTEVFPYSTWCEELGAGNLMLIMNIETFESLPEEVQQAMNDYAWYGSALAGAVWDYESREAIETSEELGHTFIVRDDAEIARWTEIANTLSDSYAARLDGLGYDGAGMLETLRALSDKYSVVTDEGWEPGTTYEPSVLKIDG